MTFPLLTLSFSVPGGAEGHVVIDSLVKGTSSGGVRIAPDLESGEVRMLAAEMSRKYAFCGLPRGGAKCGIRMPSGLAAEERMAVLEEVGRRLKAVIDAGIYYPGMDMNCGQEELRAIYRGAGHTLGALTDTSFYTAVFVAEAVRACAEILFHGQIRPLALAVEGFGAVASHLAERLDPSRFRIVALSTVRGAVHDPEGFDPTQLRCLRAAHGDGLVDHLPGARLETLETLLTLPVDILVPAARVGSIRAASAESVKARCIVPAANAPCTDEALADLQRRGIPVLPGFVCNAGGVLGSSLFDRGVPQTTVERLAAGPYGQAVRSLLRRSLELGASPTELAGRIAVAVSTARRQAPLSRLRRLLDTLARRVGPIGRLANRHAARDCASHFRQVASLVTRLEVGLPVPPPGAPAVSVIMPVHGTEKYLPTAIRSVLNQTFADFELLVLNDGSPGDVRGALSGFDDSRIRLLEHENRGPAFTRNRGVRESCGRFTAFLDSDDAWHPDKLSRQVALLLDRPDVDIVYTQRATMDQDGRDVEGYRPKLREGLILDDLYVDNCICMSSAMLRREVFDLVGFLDERLRMSEDFDFWLRVACGHRFAAIDEPLVRYRLHSGQASLAVEERVRVAWEIRRDFDAAFGHLVGPTTRKKARALHHRGKGDRAAGASQNVLRVQSHYLCALLHYPLDLASWVGLARTILPRRIRTALRRAGRG